MSKISAEKIWKEYERACRFNESIHLYETVEKNEDFYIGNQWRGVNAPDLDKPVMNILSRVVRFFIATIVSDDIGISLTHFDTNVQQEPVLQMLKTKLDEAMEEMEFRKKTRMVIRNAAVNGDGCLHYYFDTHRQTAFGQGMIQSEIIENTNIHFGNPYHSDVQSQPYLLISFQKPLDQLKKEMPHIDWGQAQQKDTQMVTLIRRYWKEENKDGGMSVWFCDASKEQIIQKATDTGLERYPIAFFVWEHIKHCFHGQSVITGIIPNQIFINKLFAMSMQHIKSMAFPKIIYNRSMIPAGWSNRVGEAIPVTGDPNVAIAAHFKAQDMSAQVLSMIDKVIAYTRETMGASDVMLGNIKPENSSAIVATQQAASMPLELQKQDFYSFVEDSIRIWLDMMRVYYGARKVTFYAEGKQKEVLYHFGKLKNHAMRLNIDIGAATYWSELMQVQTLDHLFQSGILQDAQMYLESMPRGYIPNKEKLLQAIKEKSEQVQQKESMKNMSKNDIRKGGDDIAM